MALIDPNGLLYGERLESKKLPDVAGIYAIFFADNLLYIGKAKHLRRRANSHKNILRTQAGLNYQTISRYENVDAESLRFSFIPIEDATERDKIERSLIAEYKPPFNRLVGGKNTAPRTNVDMYGASR